MLGINESSKRDVLHSKYGTSKSDRSITERSFQPAVASPFTVGQNDRMKLLRQPSTDDEVMGNSSSSHGETDTFGSVLGSELRDTKRRSRNFAFVVASLVMRDFRVRYRNMSLGILWSLANPLIMMLVLTF